MIFTKLKRNYNVISCLALTWNLKVGVLIISYYARHKFKGFLKKKYGITLKCLNINNNLNFIAFELLHSRCTYSIYQTTFYE